MPSGTVSQSRVRLVLSDNSACGVSPFVRSEFAEVVMAGIEVVGTAGGAGVLGQRVVVLDPAVGRLHFYVRSTDWCLP